MRAQFTRADLERAFNECVERHGRGHAVDALLKATGIMYWFEVPADKISAAMAALTGRAVAETTARMAAQASSRDRLKLVHDRLNWLSATIFAAKKTRNGRA